MSHTRCPNCNKYIEEDSQYCSYCGFKIPHKEEKIKCPRCQNEVSDLSKFCPLCGNEIHRKEAPESPATAPSKNLIKCPNCKRDVTPSCTKCFYCGHSITTSEQIEIIKVSDTLIRCPKCERNIMNSSDICPYCGFRIKPETEEEKKKVKLDRKLASVVEGASVIIFIVGIIFIFKFCNPSSTKKEISIKTPPPQLTESKVHNFVSSRNNFTDNNLNVTTFDEKCYLTFDYNQEVIKMRILNSSSNSYDNFSFKMIKFEKNDSPVLGLVYLIYVHGNLPKLNGIETFKFNPNGKIIWVDGPGGTLTFAVEPI